VGFAGSRRWHWSGCSDGERRRRAARADGRRCGKTGRGQRGSEKWRRGGTWLGVERREGGGARHMAGAGDGAAQRRNRGAGLEEEDKDWSVIFQKCRDLTVMSW
jgi:hypothetical protein